MYVVEEESPAEKIPSVQFPNLPKKYKEDSSKS